MSSMKLTTKAEKMAHIFKSKPSGNTYTIFILNLKQNLHFINIFTMKGDKKKGKTWFKSGNKYSPGSKKGLKLGKNSEYVRPTVEEAELMDVDPVIHSAMASTSQTQENKPDTMILRPRKYKPDYKHSCRTKKENLSMEHDRYKVFHVGKLLEMFNTAINEHSQNFPRCHGQLTFDRQAEERWGLVWRESMVCRTCSYKSNMHKLYTEVAAAAGQPGRKKATVNLGMSIALTQTPIRGESLTRLLAGGNIEGPSKRSISRTSKSAGQIIIAANNADMSKRLQQLRKVNRWQGRPENVIPVQVDGVYNNNLYSGVGRTPFQPATQCTVTVAENLTPKKQIVAVETINKLCSKHGFHTKDDGTECDNKSAPCSATATIETNIGDEQQWAENCFRQLKHEGIETKFVTTDGDGKSFAAARKLYESGVTNTEPIHQLDTRHLSANHRKFMKSSPRVTEIMPGKTKTYRLCMQNKFALDMSQRCQAELKNIVKKHGCSQTRVLQETRIVMSTIKQCYGGNHSLCKLHSYVCYGENNNNWLLRSIFLPKTFRINIKNETSEKVLMECIEYRLGDDTVQLTRLNTNTQKVEGTNRAIKRSLPKDRTFSRNFQSRAHSALHSVNNGPGNSIRKLCAAAGCPITPGSNADVHLELIQKQSEKRKIKEKSMAFKLKRRQRKQRIFSLYEKYRERKNYMKNQLTRHLQRAGPTTNKVQPRPGSSSDHAAYTRVPLSGRRRSRAKIPTSSSPQ